MTNPAFESDHPRITDGTFTDKTQSTPEVALVVENGGREVKNVDLQNGDVLVGDNDSGRLTVITAQPSSSLPGFIAVETNFGFLYLDADGTTQVASDSERHFDFTVETMTEDEFGGLWSTARARFGYAGTFYQRGDIESVIDLAIEGDGAPADIDRDAVWDIVRDSPEWRSIADGGVDANDAMEYAVGVAILKVTEPHTYSP